MAKTKSKPGPKPTFGEGNKMEKRISIVVTDSQAKAIQEIATAKGKSVSTWAREVVLAAIPEEVS